MTSKEKFNQYMINQSYKSLSPNAPLIRCSQSSKLTITQPLFPYPYPKDYNTLPLNFDDYEAWNKLLRNYLANKSRQRL